MSESDIYKFALASDVTQTPSGLNPSSQALVDNLTKTRPIELSAYKGESRRPPSFSDVLSECIKLGLQLVHVKHVEFESSDGKKALRPVATFGKPKAAACRS